MPLLTAGAVGVPLVGAETPGVVLLEGFVEGVEFAGVWLLEGVPAGVTPELTGAVVLPEGVEPVGVLDGVVELPEGVEPVDVLGDVVLVPLVLPGVVLEPGDEAFPDVVPVEVLDVLEVPVLLEGSVLRPSLLELRSITCLSPDVEDPVEPLADPPVEDPPPVEPPADPPVVVFAEFEASVEPVVLPDSSLLLAPVLGSRSITRLPPVVDPLLDDVPPEFGLLVVVSVLDPDLVSVV